MFFIATLINSFEPLILAGLINTLQLGGEDLLPKALLWLLLFPLFELMFWIFHGIARIIERKTAFIVSQNYTTEMFRRVTDLPLKWHRNHHTGESYDKINKASKALFSFSENIYSYLGTLLKLAFSCMAIIYFLPRYGALTVLFGGFVILIVKKFDKKLIKNEKTINDAENRVTSALFDYVSNINTVITLRLEKLARSEVSKRIQGIMGIFIKTAKINEWKWFLTTMVIQFGTVAILGFYIYDLLSIGETVMIGSFMALYQYVLRVNDGFFSIGWQWESLVVQSTKVKSAETIVTAHQALIKKQNSHPGTPGWKSIHIRKLSFSYEDDQHKIRHLRDIDLHLKRGSRIALVGESGSGKSTLMKILRGLESPERGSMLIDGKPEKNLSFMSDTSTLMPQEPEIFENTIEYNITAGIKHKKSDITEAVKIAQFTQVLNRLPNGLKSGIKEKGVNLSGGEKQRLALARGIFAAKDSSIILLDEPTSSVDSSNEKKIYTNLFQHFENQCVVSSIHKLQLLPLFDYIYIIEEGRLVEEGSYRNLSQKERGHLRRMLKNYKTES
jgi:ABC-type bacteriocin/lantibiotic exporter with double-glycine peptidase domain